MFVKSKEVNATLMLLCLAFSVLVVHMAGLRFAFSHPHHPIMQEQTMSWLSPTAIFVLTLLLYGGFQALNRIAWALCLQPPKR